MEVAGGGWTLVHGGAGAAEGVGVKKRTGALSHGRVVVCRREVKGMCCCAGACGGRGRMAREGAVVTTGVRITGRGSNEGEPDDKAYHDEHGSPCTIVACAARGHPLFS